MINDITRIYLTGRVTNENIQREKDSRLQVGQADGLAQEDVYWWLTHLVSSAYRGSSMARKDKGQAREVERTHDRRVFDNGGSGGGEVVSKIMLILGIIVILISAIGMLTSYLLKDLLGVLYWGFLWIINTINLNYEQK